MPKFCSYSCVYCQVGKTRKNIINRQVFYPVCDILTAVKNRVDNSALRNERIDYLTFVSDGEPTLDVNLGEEISLLKQMGIPIAVLTNASLLWSTDVKQDLLKADYVSLKVDAVSESLWRQIDRPHKKLKLSEVLDSIQDFAEAFDGTLVTETMLVSGVPYFDEFEKTAIFLAGLKNLHKSYLAVPTRPPTEKWVKSVPHETLNVAFQVFSEKLGVSRVEYLINYEGNLFGFTENVEKDLLSIMAVHPMRAEAVKAFLERTNTNWQTIERLVAVDALVELEYEGNKYYMRKNGGK